MRARAPTTLGSNARLLDLVALVWAEVLLDADEDETNGGLRNASSWREAMIVRMGEQPVVAL